MSKITISNNQNRPLMVTTDGLMIPPGVPFEVDSEDPIVASVVADKLVSVLSPTEPVEVAELVEQETLEAEPVSVETEVTPEVAADESANNGEPGEVQAESQAPVRTTRKKTSTQVKES